MNTITVYIIITGGFGKGTQSNKLIARTMIVNYKLGEINAGLIYTSSQELMIFSRVS